ncbi:hypothetical protein SEUCBS139899_002213 [Sporothrix eucalyptigena]
MPDIDSHAQESINSRQTEDPDNVNDEDYRIRNLLNNGIEIRHRRMPVPDGPVSRNITAVLHADRSSPGPSTSQVDAYLDDLAEMSGGCTETDLRRFFSGTVFHERFDPLFGRSRGLGLALHALMPAHLVPDEQPRISQPRPHLLFGYTHDHGQDSFVKLHTQSNGMLHQTISDFSEVTDHGLSYPFLVVEYTDGRGAGSRWATVNRCAAGTTACLAVVNQLNRTLTESNPDKESSAPHPTTVDNIVYAMAIDHDLVHVYVGWMEDNDKGVPNTQDKHIMQLAESFALWQPDGFTGFRRCVRNILAWGIGPRREAICKALGALVDGSRTMEYKTKPSEV